MRMLLYWHVYLCAGVIQDQTQQQAGLAADPDTNSSSNNATTEDAAKAAPIVAGLTGESDPQQQQQQQQQEFAMEPLAVTTLSTTLPTDNTVGSTPAGKETEQLCRWIPTHTVKWLQLGSAPMHTQP
jgi:hypothetical protein